MVLINLKKLLTIKLMNRIAGLTMNLKEALINKDLKNLKNYFNLKFIIITDLNELDIEKTIYAFENLDSSSYEEEFEKMKNYSKFDQRIRMHHYKFFYRWAIPIENFPWEGGEIWKEEKKNKNLPNQKNINYQKIVDSQKALENIRNEIKNNEKMGRDLFPRYLIRY